MVGAIDERPGLTAEDATLLNTLHTAAANVRSTAKTLIRDTEMGVKHLDGGSRPSPSAQYGIEHLRAVTALNALLDTPPVARLHKAVQLATSTSRGSIWFTEGQIV